MKTRVFPLLLAGCVLVVAAWVLGARTVRSASVDRAPAVSASSGQIVVVPTRDLTFFYIVDGNDGNIYVVDVSGSSGEVRGIKLAGNFRTRRTF